MPYMTLALALAIGSPAMPGRPVPDLAETLPVPLGDTWRSPPPDGTLVPVQYGMPPSAGATCPPDGTARLQALIEAQKGYIRALQRDNARLRQLLAAGNPGY